MATPPDNLSMALFCDFENVALGVRDAHYDKFDIKKILERLLLKGSIVVKKAYCDWERYKGFKATMHEANFELIEIPHVRQSGKNSADIRLVVDALDLCYTKSHVNTFVIISGDSDFSPLVSKLRENAKQVIGVGVKQSTSDLLIANCDEFIFYDDLVRESQRNQARRQPADAAPRRTPEEERQRKDSLEARRSQAIEMAVETFEALVAERGDTGKIWASMLKEAIKRRKPDFSEGYYGFRTFGTLLEEAQARGLLEFGRDDKSGAYVFRRSGAVPAPLPTERAAPERGRAERPAVERAEAPAEHPVTSYFHQPALAPVPVDDAIEAAAPEADAADTPPPAPRRRGRGGRSSATARGQEGPAAPAPSGGVEAAAPEAATAATATTPAEPAPAAPAAAPRGRARRPARSASAAPTADAPVGAEAPSVAPVPPASEAAAEADAPARRAAARPRRPRQPPKPAASDA
ncbi:NYN domain-containing protein [Aquabacterium sp. A08]|uniref:NYN domain-containing protein n=1 Tax=Aquabacterium sp. A08 TaxID=2718532 RepID=UPI001422C229|nr:NYN domain-containing protein [Aquabacterium sp. A08]NIC42850.1 NYN domain-containing protein [Aquabacterium sp. A08]